MMKNRSTLYLLMTLSFGLILYCFTSVNLYAASANSIIQAHEYNEKNGSVKLETVHAPDGTSLGYISAGDWLRYQDIDFGNGAYDTFMATIAATDDCQGKSIEIRLDSVTGQLIGTLNINVTGSWSLFQEQYASIANVTGVHDVYLVFPEAPVCNIDWFTFGINPDNDTEEEKNQRMAWWREARFGQFIHWGAYSELGGYYNGVSGGAEWIMIQLQISKTNYENDAAKPFNPTSFNATEWVNLCKVAGQKYMVITSKHHDGFSMFDTEIRNFKPYSVVDFGSYGSDPLVELSDACKAEGIKFGLYYSIWDWHHPYFSSWGDQISAANKPIYIMEMKEQLREIIESLNPDVLWFDGEWTGWWTKGDGQKLYKYLRTIKHDLIINNRVGKRHIDDGDFGTPEQEIPANGMDADWESCMTINDHWGYRSTDYNWKSTKTLITNLVDIASKGGNYLLNIGPTGEGIVPQGSVDRLQEMGTWLSTYGDSIYDTMASCYSQSVSWGRFTTKDGKLYIHVLDWPSNNQLVIPAIVNTIHDVHMMNNTNSLTYNANSSNITITLPTSAPNALDSVIVVEVDGIPEAKVRKNLALNKPATVSNVYQNNSSYNAAKAVDGNMGTRWATDDQISSAWLEVDLEDTVTFNEVYIDEWYHGTLRVQGYTIDYYDGNGWFTAYTGTTIGSSKTISFTPVTGSKVRLNITAVAGNYGPTIHEFQVYNN